MGVLGTLNTLADAVSDPFGISTDITNALTHHVIGLDQTDHTPLSTIILKAGWVGKNANLAQWVVYAESKGDADIVNSAGAVGLFQILESAHLGQHGSPSTHDAWVKYMQDPQNNANFAHWLWANAGDSFAPDWAASQSVWGPHVSGDAPPKINVSHKNVNDSIVTDATNAAGGVLSGVDEIGHVIGYLADPRTWLRLGKGALGGVLVIAGVGGLVYVAAKSVSSQPITKAAIKVASS